MMEATSDRPFVKKSFLERAQANAKAKGMAPPPVVMQVRCPKCGMRWRMKSDQLR